MYTASRSLLPICVPLFTLDVSGTVGSNPAFIWEQASIYTVLCVRAGGEHDDRLAELLLSPCLPLCSETIPSLRLQSYLRPLNAPPWNHICRV
ncbi:hypothetical protein B0H17DRAFT_561821 [Mycena rosella]|uniref:Uncharacterized protein n=1 Tax=Mycena rosella TaxID=1033263 RepID=A0AAD7BPI7_MYCRO|nr:hypothetical protein B0H17DRAFT_561821 [Mycena rosella]